ncbi:Core protein [Sea otter poxvirus]|uniref:Core protein n=1 Tax=Sea otter poxvirus TaxID=1416741 RepID=A0A2U9QHS2_9POXV|nr:Core protein [Sea otter poxvirus]AWU47150.1 Core protein [Sea otter poxvirus]
MLVDDNTIIIHKKGTPWPLRLFFRNGNTITETNKNVYFYDDNFDVAKLSTVVLINPTSTQLIKTCVYLRSKSWMGDIYILFDKQLGCYPCI